MHRIVVFKITDGGRLAACHPESTSDLAIRVTEVPDGISAASVLTKLSQISWLPISGPWSVAWERVDNAKYGAILRL